MVGPRLGFLVNGLVTPMTALVPSVTFRRAIEAYNHQGADHEYKELVAEEGLEPPTRGL